MRESDRLDGDQDRSGVVSRTLATAARSEKSGTPTPGFWIRVPKDEPDRNLRLVALVALLVLLALAFENDDSLVFLPLGFGLFLATMLLDSRKSLRPTAADLALLENPDDSEVCLVRLSIYRGERRVGVDRGVVWFAEDRLHFAGRATSFALGGQDIVSTTERRAAPGTVELRHPEGEASLILVPLAPRTPVGEMQRACFAFRFEAFRAKGRPVPGPRQWPPLEP